MFRWREITSDEINDTEEKIKITVPCWLIARSLLLPDAINISLGTNDCPRTYTFDKIRKVGGIAIRNRCFTFAYYFPFQLNKKRIDDGN